MINNGTPRRQEGAISIDELEQQFNEEAQQKGLTIDELEQEYTVANSAADYDSIVQENYDRYIQDIKDNPTMGRALSATNSFMQGLTEFVPGAVKTLNLIQSKVAGSWTPQTALGYSSGVILGEALQEIFPDNPVYRNEFWAGTMARGAGQMTGQVIASLATAGGGAGAVFGANAMMGATLGSRYYEEAKASGADDDTAFQAMLLNMGGDATLNAIPMALMMRRVDQATGGGIKQLAKSGFKGSVHEGLTEATQQFYSNVVASAMYDSTRDLLEGVGESAVAGALLGGFADITLNSILNRGAIAKTPEEIAAVKESVEYVFDNYADQLGDVTRNDADSFLNDIKRGEEQVDNKTGESVTQDPASATETTLTETGIAEPQGVKGRNLHSRSKWKKWYDKWVPWAPLGEKKIGLIQEHERAWLQAQRQESYLRVTRFNQAVLDHFGSKKSNVNDALKAGEIDSDIIQTIDQALRDPEAMKNVPEPIRGPLQDMRRHINTLTVEFVKRGYVQGDVAVHYMENLGVYVHRAYKLFDPSVEWNLKTIPPDVLNSALVFFRNKIRSQIRAEGKNWSAERINREATKRVKEIIYADEVGSVFQMFRDNDQAFAIDKGDRDVMLQRQDIPKPIRDLMGEFSEPSFNYVSSIEKMAGTLARRQMYDMIADAFEGDLFLTKEQQHTRPDIEEWRKRLETGTGSKLDKLYMHNDMYEALTHVNNPENQNPFLTGLYRFNAASKYAKTVLSHVTVVRNVTGGMMFMGFNGLFFDLKSFSPAFQAAKQSFLSIKQLDKQGLAEKNIELSRLNLKGKSVRAGEFKDVLFDAKLLADNPHEAQLRFFERLATGGKQSGLKKIGKFFNVAADFYRAGDDFVRIWFYELEKARQQQADPSITDQDVADLTNDLYQNYERLGRLTKEFRKVPVIAPFVSFPAEVIRTSANTVVQARKEINSDNPKMRKIGYRRIAGVTSTIAGVVGAGIASQLLNRITDDEDQAYREFMPPWDENAIIAYTQAGGGTVRYINTSYTNPYAYLMDPLFAAFKSPDDATNMEIFMNSMWTLFEPILNEEIFAQAVREVVTNHTSQGGEVYNPQDSLGDKWQKGYLHLWKAFEPGSLSSAKRFVEPMYDGDSKKKVSHELLGLFGLRLITVDVKDSFGFSIREQRQAIRDARRVYNSVKFRENAGFGETEDAYNVSNEQYERVFNRMRILVDSAVQAGVPYFELEEVMKDSGLSQRDIKALRTGVFQPFDR